MNAQISFYVSMLVTCGFIGGCIGGGVGMKGDIAGAEIEFTEWNFFKTPPAYLLLYTVSMKNNVPLLFGYHVEKALLVKENNRVWKIWLVANTNS